MRLSRYVGTGMEYLNTIGFGQQLKIATIFALVATGMSAILVFLSGFRFQITFWETSAVFTSYICMVLFITQTRQSYWFGIISTICYVIALFENDFYALGLFNLYLLASFTFGFFRWGPDAKPRPINRIKINKWLFAYLALAVAIYVVLQLLNIYVVNGEISNPELWATVLSGVAQLMLDNRCLDCWFVWIVVNIMSIGIFFNDDGLALVAFQHIFYLIIAATGFLAWMAAYRRQEDEKDPPRNI